VVTRWGGNPELITSESRSFLGITLYIDLLRYKPNGAGPGRLGASGSRMLFGWMFWKIVAPPPEACQSFVFRSAWAGHSRSGCIQSLRPVVTWTDDQGAF
jgi:hypothetical protein